MKTKPFIAIKSRCRKLTRSLVEKYPLILKGLSISVLSEDDFRRSMQKQDAKQIYFTKDELDYCKKRISSLAGRFAAKMAVNEALQRHIPWNEINILSSQTGEPVLSFSDNIDSFISISISHEEDLVIAVAGCTLQGNAVAVGIDATSITRISALVPQTKIMKKILTSNELHEIKNPINMAEKWSGKEAVSKAIGIGIWHGASLREIEILTSTGMPVVKLHGKVAGQAKTKGLNRWELNYIYDNNFVLAAVLATG
jgi:phosphopantetheine--protein transferase-like protein